MTPRLHTSTPLDTRKQPPCEARRRHIFGPIVPMDRPVGEWPLWAGVALMFGVGVVATFIAVIVP